eukprot:4068550-Pleurochrysis_carterae.AAC.1
MNRCRGKKKKQALKTWRGPRSYVQLSSHDSLPRSVFREHHDGGCDRVQGECEGGRHTGGGESERWVRRRASCACRL